MRRVFLSEDSEISDHQQTQGDPVITEGLEIVLLDEAHQELDHQQGHQEGDNHAGEEHRQFQPGEAKPLLFNKSEHLDGAPSHHSGNRHKEGKFRRHI